MIKNCKLNLITKLFARPTLVEVDYNLYITRVNKSTSSVSQSQDDDEKEIPPSFVIENDEIIDEKPKNFFNKSRLLPQHRKLLKQEKPYDEPHSWIHLKEKYQRKLYGRYGAASGVDPRICFPTKADQINEAQYEKVAFPFTLKQMMEVNKQKKEIEHNDLVKRQEEIAKKLEKLDQWKKDLNAKIAKKESDALEAKQRKERIIEEVRRHFGYKIDSRDERYQELIDQKEREDRKKQKELKRKVKEEKMVLKLVDKNKALIEDKPEKSDENIEKVENVQKVDGKP